MMKKTLGVICLLALLSLPALAGENGPGCGFGKVIFDGSKGKVPHLLAMTTNAASTQSSSITSGTSGCDSDRVILRQHEQKVFVALNFNNLSQDMAQGAGEYVMALAELMGCPSRVYGEFSELSRQRYSVLFDTLQPKPVQWLAGLKQEMAGHAVLGTACTRIG